MAKITTSPIHVQPLTALNDAASVDWPLARVDHPMRTSGGSRESETATLFQPVPGRF